MERGKAVRDRIIEGKFTRPMYCIKDRRVDVEKRRRYMKEYMKRRRNAEKSSLP